MKQVVQNLKNGKTEVIEVPAPGIRDGHILVRTAFSLVSTGTERNLVEFAEKSLVGKARSRPDLFKQVLEKAKREGILSTLDSALNRLDQPLVLGYSSSGTVIEVGQGVTDFKPGDRVVSAGGGYAVHAEYALVPKNLAAHLGNDVPFEYGAFGTLGAIALNGIRLASLQVGEKVAVIGLGLMGLITCQLAAASGCEVSGFDINLARIKFAKNLGINAAANKSALNIYQSLTRGRGFDHVLICADTPSDDPVELAGVIARDRASVISIGVVGLNLPRKPYYEKEIAFRVSRSAGPGRYDSAYEEKGADYPVGYVRWTEGRNLEAFVDLLSLKKIDVSGLVTHRFAIEDAAKAYALISGKTTEEYLGVLLSYPDSKEHPARSLRTSDNTESQTQPTESVVLGVLGAGNYAGAVFLPAVKKTGGVCLEGIASSGGTNAQTLGRKFGFGFVSSSVNEIQDNKRINTVAILTRHDTHARLTIEALKKGKNVYCEKPLALNKNDLITVEKIILKKDHPYLMVGFNRRFAPFSKMLRAHFNNRAEPLYAHYRINAGSLPLNHWLNDPETGGGRLVGEGCHFIDFLAYLTGEPITRVRVNGLPDKGKYAQDNLSITLEFLDGSIGTIAYLANGSRSFAKEYVEVFCGGKIGILDDFRKLTLVDDHHKQVLRSRFKQDKGHGASWKAFLTAIKNGKAEPIPYADILHTSYATLACLSSLQTGKPVSIPEFIQAA